MIRRLPWGFLSVVVLFLVAIALLQYKLWRGEAGIDKIQVLERQVQQLRADNKAMRRRNQALYDEVVSLKKNNEVVEGLARSNLGYIKKDETFYQLVRPQHSVQKKSLATESETPASRVEQQP